MIDDLPELAKGVLGALLVAVVALLWNLLRAPVRQRDEARVERDALRSSQDEKKVHEIRVEVLASAKLTLADLLNRMPPQGAKADEVNAWAKEFVEMLKMVRGAVELAVGAGGWARTMPIFDEAQKAPRARARATVENVVRELDLLLRETMSRAP